MKATIASQSWYSDNYEAPLLPKPKNKKKTKNKNKKKKQKTKKKKKKHELPWLMSYEQNDSVQTDHLQYLFNSLICLNKF